jgi:hypothetical protein
MQNLSMNDGFKEFSINNDPNRVIRFNPSDFGIIDRINSAYAEIEKSTNIDTDVTLKNDGTAKDDLEKAAMIVQQVSNTIKGQIDYIFNSPVSDIVFGKQSPLSLVGGMPLYEQFLNVVIPVIKKNVQTEQESSRKRVNKYVDVIK